ncbi:MAG: hypothetical protein IJV22_07740 [Bacteroidales bacterium]|nr:hypothetical protein [Bacteroidales bacterium]
MKKVFLSAALVAVFGLGMMSCNSKTTEPAAGTEPTEQAECCQQKAENAAAMDSIADTAKACCGQQKECCKAGEGKECSKECEKK